MKTTLFRALVMLLLGAFLTTLTAGCNTMKGVGEDIENAGDKIEDATDEAVD